MSPRPLALALIALAGAASVSAGEEIVIEATAVRPPVLQVSLQARVTFVNRSGRTVHVEFLGDQGEHHVVQVPGRIAATFLRPGRHPYVVHFYAPSARDLRGVVEVGAGAGPPAEPYACAGTALGGICLER